MKTFFHFLFLLCIVLGPLVTSGCGSGRLATEFVSGTVTVDGVPLEDAQINFIPAVEGVGETAGGYTQTDGGYKLSSMNGDAGRGAVAADYLITISKDEIKGVTVHDPVHPFDEVSYQINKPLLSPLYFDAKKTILKATVKKGKNKIDFDLKSKP